MFLQDINNYSTVPTHCGNFITRAYVLNIYQINVPNNGYIF